MTASAMRDSLESGPGGPPGHPAGGRARAELGYRPGEVVDAVQGFDDDALHPEVITPDLFHEFGVVLAFHPDPAGLGHLRALARHPDRTRGCPAGCRRPAACRGAGGISLMGRPSSRNPKPSRKDRDLPRRSSSATTCMPPDFSTRVTAPTQPDWTSSSTMPRSTGTSGSCVRRGRTCPAGPQFW